MIEIGNLPIEPQVNPVMGEFSKCEICSRSGTLSGELGRTDRGIKGRAMIR